ncbi:MAG: hypothetical protein M0P31_02150 [Solirubrobacteraceae bacterium]|nr:hypothetical protein [Solirubrobacteraceae bacterium]
MPPTAIQPVMPTTQVEIAEERLSRDVADLTATVRTATSPFDIRRVEAHVTVDERRVRSLRALPCHRQGRSEEDVRWTLAMAYDELAAAYRRRGQHDRAAWATLRASEERNDLAVAA